MLSLSLMRRQLRSEKLPSPGRVDKTQKKTRYTWSTPSKTRINHTPMMSTKSGWHRPLCAHRLHPMSTNTHQNTPCRPTSGRHQPPYACWPPSISITPPCRPRGGWHRAHVDLKPALTSPLWPLSFTTFCYTLKYHKINIHKSKF